MTEDEMVGWHHRLNGYEFQEASGVGDGFSCLASHSFLPLFCHTDLLQCLECGMLFSTLRVWYMLFSFGIFVPFALLFRPLIVVWLFPSFFFFI